MLIVGSALKGYGIEASDGSIGHVENPMIDDASWMVGYLTVDTRNWWPGKYVLISPHAVRGAGDQNRQIDLNVTHGQVTTSPAWDPAGAIGLTCQEQSHGRYGWPGL